LDNFPGLSFLFLQTPKGVFGWYHQLASRKVVLSGLQWLFLLLSISETSSVVSLTLIFALGEHQPPPQKKTITMATIITP
jgi:hypothetical protein